MTAKWFVVALLLLFLLPSVNAVAWNGETTITAADDKVCSGGWRSCVAVTTDGRIHVVLRDTSTNYHIFYFSSEDGGETFNPWGDVGPYKTAGTHLIADEDDNLHLAYGGYGNNLKYKLATVDKLSDPLNWTWSWGAQETVTTAALYYVTMGLDRYGNKLVVGESTSAATSPYVYSFIDAWSFIGGAGGQSWNWGDGDVDEDTNDFYVWSGKSAAGLRINKGDWGGSDWTLGTVNTVTSAWSRPSKYKLIRDNKYHFALSDWTNQLGTHYAVKDAWAIDGDWTHTAISTNSSLGQGEFVYSRDHDRIFVFWSNTSTYEGIYYKNRSWDGGVYIEAEELESTIPGAPLLTVGSFIYTGWGSRIHYVFNEGVTGNWNVNYSFIQLPHTLRISDGPDITIGAAAGAPPLLNTSDLNCSVNITDPVAPGVSLYANFTWFVNGHHVSTYDSPESPCLNDTICHTTVLFDNSETNEGDWVQCKVSAGNGTLVSPNNWDGVNKTSGLHIIDTTEPYWDELPIDQTVELGEAFHLDVNATDYVMVDTYYINGTPGFQIDPDTGEITEPTPGSLAIGVYGLNISVNDTSNNMNSTNIAITVVDTTPPRWVTAGGSATTDVYTTALAFWTLYCTAAGGKTSTWIVVGPPYRGTAKFDVSGLPGGATVTDVDFYGMPQVCRAGHDLDIYHLANDPIPTGGAALYVDARDGTNYVIDDTALDTDSGCASGVWAPPIDLGATAAADLQGAIGVAGWFGLGFSTNAAGFGYFRGWSYGAQRPYLKVTYSTTTWLPELEDQFVYYNTPFLYDVDAVDVDLDIYYINATPGFTINAANGEITNSSFLAAGDYGLNVSVRDHSMNMNSSIILITVDAPPSWFGGVGLPNATAGNLTGRIWADDNLNCTFAVNISSNNNPFQYSVSWWVQYLNDTWEQSGTWNITNATMNQEQLWNVSIAPTPDDVNHTEEWRCVVQAEQLGNESAMLTGVSDEFTGEWRNSTLLTVDVKALTIGPPVAGGVDSQNFNVTVTNTTNIEVLLNVTWNGTAVTATTSEGLCVFENTNTTNTTMTYEDEMWRAHINSTLGDIIINGSILCHDHDVFGFINPIPQVVAIALATEETTYASVLMNDTTPLTTLPINISVVITNPYGDVMDINDTVTDMPYGLADHTLTTITIASLATLTEYEETTITDALYQVTAVAGTFVEPQGTTALGNYTHDVNFTSTAAWDMWNLTWGHTPNRVDIYTNHQFYVCNAGMDCAFGDATEWANHSSDVAPLNHTLFNGGTQHTVWNIPLVGDDDRELGYSYNNNGTMDFLEMPNATAANLTGRIWSDDLLNCTFTPNSTMNANPIDYSVAWWKIDQDRETHTQPGAFNLTNETANADADWNVSVAPTAADIMRGEQWHCAVQLEQVGNHTYHMVPMTNSTWIDIDAKPVVMEPYDSFNVSVTNWTDVAPSVSVKWNDTAVTPDIVPGFCVFENTNGTNTTASYAGGLWTSHINSTLGNTIINGSIVCHDTDVFDVLREFKINDDNHLFSDYKTYFGGSSVPPAPGAFGTWTVRDAESTLAEIDGVYQTTTARASMFLASQAYQMFEFECGSAQYGTMEWQGMQARLVFGWTGYRNFYMWNEDSGNWDILFTFGAGFPILYTENLTSTQISDGLRGGKLYFAALVNGWTANKESSLRSDYINLTVEGNNTGAPQQVGLAEIEERGTHVEILINDTAPPITQIPVNMSVRIENPYAVNIDVNSTVENFTHEIEDYPLTTITIPTAAAGITEYHWTNTTRSRNLNVTHVFHGNSTYIGENTNNITFDTNATWNLLNITWGYTLPDVWFANYQFFVCSDDTNCNVDLAPGWADHNNTENHTATSLGWRHTVFNITENSQSQTLLGYSYRDDTPTDPVGDPLPGDPWCPLGEYWDRVEEQCSFWLVITPEEITGDAERGEVKSRLLSFRNIGDVEGDVDLVTSLSLNTHPTRFSLEPGDMQNVVVEAEIPLLIETEVFTDQVDVYTEEGVELYEVVPINFELGELRGILGEIIVVVGDLIDGLLSLILLIISLIMLLLTSRTVLFALVAGGGMMFGILLAIVFVVLGLHYENKEKHEWAVACWLIALFLFVFMGGLVLWVTI